MNLTFVSRDTGRPQYGPRHKPQPATQFRYFFSNLGSRRRWEKPACNYHFPSVVFSLQEGLVSRSPIRVVMPQTTTLDHSSVGITESMSTITMDGGIAAGDGDAAHCPVGVVAAFVHKSSTSSSQARFSSS